MEEKKRFFEKICNFGGRKQTKPKACRTVTGGVCVGWRRMEGAAVGECVVTGVEKGWSTRVKR